MKKGTRLGIVINILVVLVLLLGGCGGGQNPTPTPNPTPSGEGVSQLLETKGQIITAQGGTVILPSGSSVSIPAGTFVTDQMVTLSLVSSLPKQPSNRIIQGVGRALVLSFTASQAAPVVPKQPSQSAKQQAFSTPGNLQFFMNSGAIGSSGMEGSAPIADIVDLTQGDIFVGISGSFNSTSNTATFTVPSQLTQNARQVVVSQANIPPAIESAPLPAPGSKIWDGTQWIDGLSGFDPSKKTLVLVHGMASSVEEAFGDKNCLTLIIRNGGYSQVVGFDYNWTQGLQKSGQDLAKFLKSLDATMPPGARVDIEAHSEGVPVALSATAQSADILSNIQIENMVLLGGPIMGTPAACVGLTAQIAVNAWLTSMLNLPTLAESLRETMFPPGLGEGGITLQGLLNSPIASELCPGSPVLADIRSALIDKMGQTGTSLSQTNIFTVAGTDYTASPDMLKLGTALNLLGLFNDERSDGIIGVSSALGVGSGLDLTPLGTYPLSHTQLECDPTVIKDVGSAVNNQPILTPTPTTTPTPTPSPTTTPTPKPTPSPEPIAVATPQISPTLSPARDLKGTWRGTGVSYWIDGATGERIIRITWDVTIVITEQKGNTVAGTITMLRTKQENLTQVDIQTSGYGPDPLENGRVSSSSLYFNCGDWRWEFTFTTDLMSGHFTTDGPGKPCDPKSFVLTRQGS